MSFKPVKGLNVKAIHCDVVGCENAELGINGGGLDSGWRWVYHMYDVCPSCVRAAKGFHGDNWVNNLKIRQQEKK